MDLHKYKREIELMKKQNMTEYDLYSIIASIIREGKNIESLSLRDVNRRRNSEKGKVFYGLSGVPDLVVLDFEFNNNDNKNNRIDNIDQIYGCIEIKGIDLTLLSAEDIIKKIEANKQIGKDEQQILGEILWYRKVLYTNGLIWRYINCEFNKNYWDVIKNLVRTNINKPNPTNWYKNICTHKFTIFEEDLIDLNSANEDQWNQFLKRLHSIKWD
ncbi:hypothetical protein [Amphibacillus indicireducens]|uniref:Uncharacterized protein n=1 Tax=Amphibacillus indicireducens TaxID=1076330 RepID=A0ABP7V7C6_9BACI